MRIAVGGEPFREHANGPIAPKKAPFSLRIGQLAEDDLTRAAAWYAERHPEGDPTFRATFRSALGVLEHFPPSGRKRSELRPDLQSFIAHPYVIFYEIDSSSMTVTILRVLHGRMDLDPDEIEDSY